MFIKMINNSILEHIVEYVYDKRGSNLKYPGLFIKHLVRCRVMSNSLDSFLKDSCNEK